MSEAKQLSQGQAEALQPEPLLPLPKFDSLFYFVVLVEAGNFSVAAERLFISQQALSKAFSQLEKQLGEPLLIRRPWQLTPAGEKRYHQARAILQQLNRLESNFRHLPEKTLQGPLRLAMLAYMNPGLLESCKQLLLAHPELQLSLQTQLTAAEIEQKLLTQELELALLPYAPRHKALKAQRYKSTPLVLVAAPQLHPPTHWHALDFITTQLPAPLDDLLAWPTEHPRRVVIEAEISQGIALAVAGQGAIWLPRHAVCRQLRAGSLCELEVELPPQLQQRQLDFYMVWAANRTHQPMLRKLRDALRPPANG